MGGGTLPKSTFNSLRYLRPEDLTLIIGAKCEDGVVLAGDRRVLRGTEYSEEKKIRLAFPNFLVGASGISGLMDNFLFDMFAYLQRPNQPRAPTWDEFIRELEDITWRLYQRYNPRLAIDEDVGISRPYALDILMGAKNFQDQSNLFHLYRNGFTQQVLTFDTIGHGFPHALPFMKALYPRARASMNHMATLCTFILTLINDHQVDLAVGGTPQIWLLPNKGEAHELSDAELTQLATSVRPTEERLWNALGL